MSPDARLMPLLRVVLRVRAGVPKGVCSLYFMHPPTLRGVAAGGVEGACTRTD